jgi:gamma-glutamyltranspeptidase/glutathione hydrolase
VRLDRSQADVVLLLRDILTLTAEGRAIFAPDGDLVGEGDRVRNPALADFLDLLAAGDVVDLSGVAAELEAAMRQGRGAVTRTDLDDYVVHERTPLALDYRGATILSNPPPSFGGSLAVSCLADLGAEPTLLEDPDSFARYARHLAGMVDRHGAGPRAVRGTTHVSVVDADGDVVAMTTSNGSCSGTFVPGTGIQLNNMMGEASLHPDGVDAGMVGARVGSMMMPTVVRGADGTLAGVGSGGSERIPSTLVRVLTGVVDLGLPLAQVVDAPRLHWDGSLLQVEPGLADDVLRRLEADWPVNRWGRPDLYFGGAHAVARRPDGTVDAVGDSRRGGSGIVVEV